jgi:positive regulator of sigma E activity
MRIPRIIQYISPLIPTILSAILSAITFYLATSINLDYRSLFLLGLIGAFMLIISLEKQKQRK